jgi:ABC-type enterochelin transport system substrate-binding protein
MLRYRQRKNKHLILIRLDHTKTVSIESVENMNPDMILNGMLIDGSVSSKNILKIKSKKR